MFSPKKEKWNIKLQVIKISHLYGSINGHKRSFEMYTNYYACIYII